MKTRNLVFILLFFIATLSSCNRHVCPTFSHPASAVENQPTETCMDDREHKL